MTEKEARDRCAALSKESPERFTHSWVARENEGVWSVVKIAVPTPGADPIETETTHEPLAVQEDPRNSAIRNVGPGGYGF